MKRWHIIVGCMIAAMVMSFCHAELAGAKARTTFKTRKIAIQKGKTYSLYAFMKKLETAWGSDDSTEEYFFSIRRAIKKGKKVALSGKGLTIKKKTFKAERTGEYKLKVKIKRKCHVFPFLVVEKNYKLKPSEAAGITISTRVMGQRTAVKVKDGEVINQIVKKINQAKYSFNFLKSLKIRVGFVGYYVELYADDGSLLKELKLDSYGFRDNWICWQSDSYLAQDCYDYIVKVYNDGLSSSA